jgi:hypothetical protein
MQSDCAHFAKASPKEPPVHRKIRLAERNATRAITVLEHGNDSGASIFVYGLIRWKASADPQGLSLRAVEQMPGWRNRQTQRT